MKPTQTVSVEFEDGSRHPFTVLAEPPSHLVFLAPCDTNHALEGLDSLALLGGLASLFVVEFDGHVFDRTKLPRSIDALRLRGQQFNAWLDQKSGVNNCVLALKSLVVSTIEEARFRLSVVSEQLSISRQPAFEDSALKLRENLRSMVREIVAEEVERALDSRR